MPITITNSSNVKSNTEDVKVTESSNNLKQVSEVWECDANKTLRLKWQNKLNVFMFSGMAGTPYYSKEGLQWTSIANTPFSNQIQGMVYFKKYFYVAVIRDGIYRTKNFTSWEKVWETTTEYPRNLTITNGKLFVCGSVLLVSDDGVNFTNVRSSLNTYSIDIITIQYWSVSNRYTVITTETGSGDNSQYIVTNSTFEKISSNYLGAVNIEIFDSRFHPFDGIYALVVMNKTYTDIRLDVIEFDSNGVKTKSTTLTTFELISGIGGVQSTDGTSNAFIPAASQGMYKVYRVASTGQFNVVRMVPVGKSIHATGCRQKDGYVVAFDVQYSGTGKTLTGSAAGLTESAYTFPYRNIMMLAYSN